MAKKDTKGHTSKKKSDDEDDDDEDDEEETPKKKRKASADDGDDDDGEDADDDDADSDDDDDDSDDSEDADVDDDDSESDDADADDSDEDDEDAKPNKKKKAKADDDEDEEVEDDDSDSGTKDVGAALAALDDEDWADTEEQGFSNPPDGRYICQIKNPKINNAKSSGRLQVSWDLIIVADPDGSKSEYSGRHLFKHDGINNSEARGWFKSGLAKLGREWPKSAKKLPKLLSELDGTYCEVSAKTKEDNDRQNYHFVRAVDESEIPEVDNTETEEDDTEEETPAPKKKKVKAPEPDDDDDEEEAEEEAPAKKKKGAPKDEPIIEIEFEESKVTPEMKKEMTKIAKENNFDPADYKTTSELMGDVGEYLGISGKFESAKKLMRTISEQNAK